MGQQQDTVFKGDIQRAVMLTGFTNKDEKGHRMYAPVRILNKIVHLNWRDFGLNEQLSIHCPKGRRITIHGRDLKDRVLNGDDYIVDCVKQSFVPESSTEIKARQKRVQQAINEEKNTLRRSFPENQVDIIIQCTKNNHGYGFSHWGQLGCRGLAALGPEIVFNRDIIDHLVEFRHGRGLFRYYNRKKFNPVYHFPSNAAREAARDTPTLGPVLQQIENEFENVSTPLLTYIIELIITAYEVWSGENAVDAAPTESAEPGKKQESTTSGKSKQASGSGKSQGKQSGDKPAKKSRPRRSKQTPDGEELKDLEFSMKSAPSQKHAKSA